MSVASWQRWVVVSTGVLLPSLVSIPAKSILEVSLEYAVPNGIGCPSEAEFRTAVADRLGDDPFVHAASRTLSVEISETGGGLNGVLRWLGHEGALEGQRRFTAPVGDCSELARNMVFAVTVQLQLLEHPEDAPPPARVPETESDAPREANGEAEAGAEAAAAAAPATSASSVAVPAPISAPASNFDVGAGLGLFLVSGWAPEVAAGGRVLFVGRVPRFSLQLALEASFPRHYPASDGNGFESSVLAASLAFCGRLPVVEACPVLRIGRVRARGTGVDEPQSSGGTLGEVGLRLGAGGALWTNLEAQAQLELLYQPSPWTVQINERSVFDAPSFVVLGGIDLVAYFL